MCNTLFKNFKAIKCCYLVWIRLSWSVGCILMILITTWLLSCHHHIDSFILRCWSVSWPTNLTYLNYWDRKSQYESLYRLSWGNHAWWYLDFSCSATSKLTFLAFTKISWQLFDGLVWIHGGQNSNVSNTFNYIVFIAKWQKLASYYKLVNINFIPA